MCIEKLAQVYYSNHQGTHEAAKGAALYAGMHMREGAAKAAPFAFCIKPIPWRNQRKNSPY